MSILSACACYGSKDGVPRRSPASWESGLRRQAGWSARQPSWRRLRSPSKPIDLACEIVFGSVHYAQGLGFEPHPDFAAAAGHLGTWAGPGTISFGKDGKPLYVFGPYDDHRSIISTLTRTVGQGNFEVLAIAG
jgi:hypothetical protein